MNYDKKLNDLDERSKQIRRDTIKLSKANGGYHYGGSFSCVEILRVLYDDILTEDDIFILSKGHSCWPLYVLLREEGYNPKLTGHPSRDPHNGITCTTGSLGHGLPMALGIALAKKQNKESGRVFVLLGDGECQEGTTWESLLIASKFLLDNLVIIVDWNNIQGSGYTNKILPISFSNIMKNFEIIENIVDGHNIFQLKECFETREEVTKLIIARTIKGKGVSFMENIPAWHAKWPSPEEEKRALEELS